MKKIIFALFLLSLILQNVSAFQEKSSVIRGRITDTSGNPLAGAGITVEGTFLGVHSDEHGEYSFTNLSNGYYKLRVSFLGFKSQTIAIQLSGEKILNVSLEEEPFTTGEVIVNGVRAGDRSPLAYVTIDSSLISRANSGQDIPFLLSMTPSLVETSEAGTGIGYTSLRVRGTDANRINVTLDGIPLNDPESQQVFWVDLPDLASSVDNIQVQRGAGTSSNGAGAFGATVSIQTKNPENEPFAQLSASAGSFNTLKKMISAGTGMLNDRFAFQMRYSELKSDGYIDRTGSNHKSAFFSGMYRTEKTHLKANIILGEEHTGIGWWGVPAEVLDTNRTYNPAGKYKDENGATRFYENESDNYKQDHFQLIYGRKINKTLNLNAAFHYTKGKGYYEEYKDNATLSEYGLAEFQIGNASITSSDLIRRKWMTNDFYGLVWSLKYKSRRLELTSGGGANNYDGDHFGRIIWMQYSGNTPKEFQWYFNNGTKNEINIFIKADYLLSERISFYGDLQYRNISYKLKGKDDDLRNLDEKHSYNFFNPKAGLFYKINQNQEAYFSFSVAHREPTRADFINAAGDLQATPQPETLYDAELGYKLRGTKSSAGINLYGMFYKDQLVPTGELSDVGYSIMTNVRRSRRLGIELSTAIKPFTFLTWDMNVTMSSNKIPDFIEYFSDYDPVTYLSTYKNKDLGTVDISYSPSLTGNSDIMFRVLKFSEIHFISKYVGKQYFDNTMSRDRMLKPYYFSNIRIDVNREIMHLKNTEFQLLINNVFNKKYESNAYGGNWYESGQEYSWSYFFPQAGINWLIRTSITF